MFRKLFLFFFLVAVLTALPFLPRGSQADRDSAGLLGGEVFPELKGKSLAGAEVSIPSGTKGKPVVLGIAFSPKAEGDLKGWLQPLYDTFLAKHEGVFAAGNFDGHVYMVALLSGAASLAGKSLEDKAAKGTDAELRPHILLSRQEATPILKALNATDKNKPYFAILDAEGRLKAVVSGAFNEAKLDELTEKAEEAE